MLAITHIDTEIPLDGALDLINRYANRGAIFDYVVRRIKRDSGIHPQLLQLNGVPEYLINNNLHRGCAAVYWAYIVQRVQDNFGVSEELFKFVLADRDQMMITRCLRKIASTGQKMRSDVVYTIRPCAEYDYCTAHTIELLGQLGVAKVIVEFDHGCNNE